MYNFFEDSRNELDIVIRKFMANECEEIITTSCIKTGWTNIVLDVVTKNNEYIFRFPRTLFFAKEMLRDYTFCNIVHGKVPYSTPNMKLMIDNNRPFSVHKKIKGTALSCYDYNAFSNNEIAKIADGIGRFLAELHKIPISCIPLEYKTKLNDYLLELAQVHKGNYNIALHRDLQKMENSRHDLCLVHGDFNSGNILVDSDFNITAVIDFSFASLSDRNADIGRFLSRTNMRLCSCIIEAYDAYSEEKSDVKRIEIIAEVFKYVDSKYICYICDSHPAIEVSEQMRNASAIFLNSKNAVA